MKKADLKPGMVVAIKTYGGFSRRAIVVATYGYVDVGYRWNPVIQPTARPERKTPKVAVAGESAYLTPEGNAWIPELVLPQQIVCTWEEYEQRQEDLRIAGEERARRDRALLEARHAQREELRGLLAQAGYEDHPSVSYYYGELKLPYALAIEIFTELVRLRAFNRINAEDMGYQ